MANRKRRSWRIPVRRPGSVEFVNGLGAQTTASRAPIFVRDLSPEGAGLTCESPCRVPLVPGSRVILHVPLGGRELALPASVTWSDDDSPQGREFGAALELHHASVAARRAYADWLVVQLHSAQRDDGEPGRDR